MIKSVSVSLVAIDNNMIYVSVSLLANDNHMIKSVCVPLV